MKHTVVGLFNSYDDADRAVSQLQSLGVHRDEISVVTHKRGDETSSVMDSDSVEDNEEIGAGQGAVLGGLTGLLVGLGALVIPGVGPVIAAGPMAAALTAGVGAGVGAVSGAVVAPIMDSLMGAGVPEEEAELYVEGIRRGGTLVSVSTTEAQSTDIKAVFERCNAVDIDENARKWRNEGWTSEKPQVERSTTSVTPRDYSSDVTRPSVASTSGLGSSGMDDNDLVDDVDYEPLTEDDGMPSGGTSLSGMRAGPARIYEHEDDIDMRSSAGPSCSPNVTKMPERNVRGTPRTNRP